MIQNSAKKVRTRAQRGKQSHGSDITFYHTEHHRDGLASIEEGAEALGVALCGRELGLSRKPSIAVHDERCTLAV